MGSGASTLTPPSSPEPDGPSYISRSRHTKANLKGAESVFNEIITKVDIEDNKVKVTSQEGLTETCDGIVLTMPVPQILQLQGSIKDLIASQLNRNLVRTNEVAPIIIRDCREEFQHVSDFKEPIVFGSIADNMPEHPLIKGKYFLVKDVTDNTDKKNTFDHYRTPNLHKSHCCLVYAAGQPTERGLVKILDRLEQEGPSETLVFNLREEPVLFVDNGSDMIPYSIKDQDSLSSPVIHGRSPTEADEAEARIRKEVIDLATMKEENKFYFYKDVENFQREPHEFHVQYEDRLLVSEEVYARHILCSHCVRFQRLCFPLTSAPRDSDVDTFLDLFKKSRNYFEKSSTYKPAMLFTCQTGQGRATVGMVMGCLMNCHKNGFPSDSRLKQSQKGSGFEKGEYRAVQRLVKLIPSGHLIKNQVDCMIDMCSDLYNIRAEIWKMKLSLEDIKKDYILDGKSAKETLYKRCCDYLERYMFLIVFNAYLTEQYPRWFSISFTSWKQQQPEIIRSLANICYPVYQTPPELVMTGAQYLVSDDYIGLDLLSTQSDVRVSNFRKINTKGVSVYGMAQPARDGVTKVSNHLLSKKQGHTFLALINLRNDCALECDGSTYCVRDASCLEEPVTHPHLSRRELESKEEELKKEIKNSGKTVLVYNEITDPPVQHEFFSLLTPSELADQQKLQTLDMMYHRIPLQYDHSLEEKDFDELMSVVCEHGLDSDPSANTAFVFFCRTGKSRTTLAMAIAGLILCHIRGFPKGTNLGEQERVSCPNAQYTKGDFIIVQKLVRLLPNGQQIKREVDFILDECFETMSTTLFHIREAIFVTYNKIKNAKTENAKQLLRRQSLDYLERYIYLILFNAYLHYDKKIQWQRTFSKWMKEVAVHCGVYELLDNLGFYDFEKMPTAFKTMSERWSSRNPDLPFTGVFA